MSAHSIHQYHTEVEKIIHFGGTKKETAIRNAFYNLLNDYTKQRGLMMIAEISIKAPNGKTVTPDGTLKDMLRQDWGYWESKDEADDLDEEIQKKFAKGYPRENILFEDSRTAVLIQNGTEVLRCFISDPNALHLLLTDFISFERPEVQNFRKAIELFKQDIPKVTETIRSIIMLTEKSNVTFIQASENFLNLCRDSINPGVTHEDVREMMIQHILTEDIFNTIFDETQFHRENNIARELETVINTFFTGNTRRMALSGIKHYYDAINAAAAGIADHHEKQKFLKVVYETFYKSYNPKAADRLGVVYTPNEIVRFMIESTDYLLHKHFDKYLEDPYVEILDPATGTGTFICDLIDYIRKEKLEYKYRHEIHANEVAILPYYISNLNIEFTFTQKTGRYVEFENLCFVDTLDNIGGLNKMDSAEWEKYQTSGDLFAITRKNSDRIMAQNKKKISVIIGNPPYNANQANENDNNKNREYQLIDKRIKDTFIKNSTAQKTKVYDMYARFYRWAFDRLDDNGIVAFVSNRSFIDSRTFDGFRKTVEKEFDAAYIIDTQSDVRTNPKIAGTTHNVFGIQTGVAIMFLIKKQKCENKTCKIHYTTLNDFWKKEQKLQWLAENPLQHIPFEIIRPDKNSNWINIADTDFDSLLPLCSKDVKAGKSNEALFELFSLGIATNRDEWVYDFNENTLIAKISYFFEKYSQEKNRWNNSDKKQRTNDFVDRAIKWTEELEAYMRKGTELTYSTNAIRKVPYRPFVRKSLYLDKIIIHRMYQNQNIFGFGNNIYQNRTIYIVGLNSIKDFSVLSTNEVPELAGLSGGSNTTHFPFYRYDKNGNRIDNITNWGLEQFVKHYSDDTITKQDIFYYVYAVLHCPAYRKKYELNLKREFPRIPLYEDFHEWSAWGKKLMDLHINYETVEPFPLLVVNASDIKPVPKARLKVNKESGSIYLDDNTELKGIPADAWNYKLGNRSALEWILDQYKESKPKDPTIAEKFNTYRFADYKEQVIDLLKRVCMVSVETMKIVAEMESK
jgi:predicted helicase